jgi:hypothetical protein
MSGAVAAEKAAPIEVDSFERWSGETSEKLAKLAKKNGTSPNEVTPPGTLSLDQKERFPVDQDLNRKLVLW